MAAIVNWIQRSRRSQPLTVTMHMYMNQAFTAIGLLTILYLLCTSLAQIFTTLPPTFSLVFSVIFLILWTVSLCLLSWNLSQTVIFTCNAKYWGNSTGISVCHLYKALFSFTVLSVASHATSVFLDARTRARSTHGRDVAGIKKYHMMGDEMMGDDPMEMTSETETNRGSDIATDVNTNIGMNSANYLAVPPAISRPLSPAASSIYSRSASLRSNRFQPEPLYRGFSVRTNDVALEPYRPRRVGDEMDDSPYAYSGGHVPQDSPYETYDTTMSASAGTARTWDDNPLYYSPWGMSERQVRDMERMRVQNEGYLREKREQEGGFI
ncbi:hypothetical protein AJ79_03736 [Helicocarpus griseus UAMH5409]|uniref:MARVEL domain-containing protein n=1 Tax=Helicocarpus griseus UAMH5409 TaxID=1447875 RepID=A0A2B7XWD9_9EURO|nr:hypothetical protein AJ79_03736 [Helicocarpus griseus UAMH5409]